MRRQTAWMRACGKIRLSARRRSAVGHGASVAASVYIEGRGVSWPVMDG